MRKQASVLWPALETAGIFDARGHLDRPLSAGTLSVPPRVELKGDRLLWWGTDDRPGLGPATHAKRYMREVRPGPDILEHFITLAEAPTKNILDFARRWGVLMICEHDLPASHNPSTTGQRATNPLLSWCYPQGWFDRTGKYDGWEPIKIWRQFSRQAHALLHIAARLHQAQVGNRDDWRTVYERSPSPKPAPWWKQSVGTEKTILARVVNEWLELGNVRVRTSWPTWRQAAPAITFEGDGLFGTLACQLLLVTHRTAGLSICSGCGLPCIPLRQPRVGQRHYCPECRTRKIPQRDAARDYRASLKLRHHKRRR